MGCCAIEKTLQDREIENTPTDFNSLQPNLKFTMEEEIYSTFMY
jgi:hypothetical protein